MCVRAAQCNPSSRAARKVLPRIEPCPGSQPFHDQLCFHCQQSAEKYLKALLEELSLHVPKTHDLLLVLSLLLPHYSELISLRRGLAFLTTFAVEVRYPDDNATKRQGLSALRWAVRVRDSCRAILGIR